jgi:hypothetical protein
MSEANMRLLYIILTALTPFAALIGAVVGIGTYYQARRREYTVQVRESQKPFLERQLQYYFEAIKVSSQVATYQTGDKFEDAKRRFWEVYWGELSIVETADVEKYMVLIGETLRAVDILRSFPRTEWTHDLPEAEYRNLVSVLADAGSDLLEKSPGVDHDEKDLQLTEIETKLFEHLQWNTFELAHAMRRSLEQGWAVNLPRSRLLKKLTDFAPAPQN